MRLLPSGIFFSLRLPCCNCSRRQLLKMRRSRLSRIERASSRRSSLTFCSRPSPTYAHVPRIESKKHTYLHQKLTRSFPFPGRIFVMKKKLGKPYLIPMYILLGRIQLLAMTRAYRENWTIFAASYHSDRQQQLAFAKSVQFLGRKCGFFDTFARMCDALCRHDIRRRPPALIAQWAVTPVCKFCGYTQKRRRGTGVISQRQSL